MPLSGGNGLSEPGPVQGAGLRSTLWQPDTGAAGKALRDAGGFGSQQQSTRGCKDRLPSFHPWEPSNTLPGNSLHIKGASRGPADGHEGLQ